MNSIVNEHDGIAEPRFVLDELEDDEDAADCCKDGFDNFDPPVDRVVKGLVVEW